MPPHFPRLHTQRTVEFGYRCANAVAHVMSGRRRPLCCGSSGERCVKRCVEHCPVGAVSVPLPDKMCCALPSELLQRPSEEDALSTALLVSAAQRKLRRSCPALITSSVHSFSESSNSHPGAGKKVACWPCVLLLIVVTFSCCCCWTCCVCKVRSGSPSACSAAALCDGLRHRGSCCNRLHTQRSFQCCCCCPCSITAAAWAVSCLCSEHVHAPL